MNTHLGYLLAISLAYTLVTGLPCAEHTFLAKQACFSKENLRHKNRTWGSCPMKTAIRLGAISPITG